MLKAIRRTGLVLLLVLALCASACAESTADVTSWYDSWTDLLFHTRNVTLDGEAVFALDSVWFKTAKGHYVQDGLNSHWQLDLETPRKNGVIQNTGFTVVANGEKIYLMEPYTPGVYRAGTNDPQSTVLRGSVQLNQVVSLARAAAELAAPALGDALQVSEEELRLNLNAENTPALLTAALNLTAQFGMKRLFGVDHDLVDDPVTESYSRWITPAAEIMHSAREFRIRKADIRMTRQDGRPASLEAVLSFDLVYTTGDVHSLDVSFKGTVSDYGTSRVDTFDPDAFGVSLSPDSMSVEDIEDMTPLDSESVSSLMPWVEQYNGLAGFDVLPPSVLNAFQDGPSILLSLGSDDGIELEIEMKEDGTLLSYTWSGLIASTGDGIYEDIPLTEADLAPVRSQLLDFVAAVDPDSARRVTALTPNWYWQNGAETWVQLVEDPITDESRYVTFIIRLVNNELQVIHYSNYSNG